MTNLLRYTRVLGFCCIILLLFVGNIFAGTGFRRVLNLSELQGSLAWSINASWELDDMSINSPQHAILLGLEPHKRTKLYKGTDFEVFLPQLEARLGDVWEIDVKGILPFIQQFHPGATTSLSSKRGAYACLQAISKTHAEILFRFHADFNLSAGIAEAEAQEVEVKKLEEKIAETEEKGKQFKLDLEKATGVERKLDLEKATAEAKKLQKEELEAEGKKLTATLGETELSEITRKLDTRFTALEQKIDKQLSELKDSLTTALTKELNERFATLQQELAKNLTTMLTKELDERFATLEQELAKNLTTLLTKELDKQVSEMKQASDKRFSALENTLTSQEARFTEQLNALSRQVAQRNAIYFTPTYFTGRLIINLEARTVEAFSLSIPMHDENATISTAGFGNPVKVSVPKMTLMIPRLDSDREPGQSRWVTSDGEPPFLFTTDGVRVPGSKAAVSSIPYVEAEAALQAVMRGNTPPDHVLKTKQELKKLRKKLR